MQELKEGILQHEPKQKLGRNVSHWLPIACSPFFHHTGPTAQGWNHHSGLGPSMSINNQEKGSRLAYRKSDGSIFPIEHSFSQKTLAWVKLSKTNQGNIPRYILYVLTLPVVYPKKDNNIYIIMTWKYKEDFFQNFIILHIYVQMC